MCLFSVSVAGHVQVYQKESKITVMSESMESSKKDVVKETLMQKEDEKFPELIILERIHDRDDEDWFLLFGVVSKKETYVPPGILTFHMVSHGFTWYKVLCSPVVKVEV